MQLFKTSSSVFRLALKKASVINTKVKDFVHVYELTEYTKMNCFLSFDGKSGYAVKNDGDIVSVFSSVKGRGKDLISHAKKRGGLKLDCFDGDLVSFYKSLGFKIEKVEVNWNGEKFPNVVYMKL
jgi:hypothetical protein